MRVIVLESRYNGEKGATPWHVHSVHRSMGHLVQYLRSQWPDAGEPPVGDRGTQRWTWRHTTHPIEFRAELHTLRGAS